MRFELRLITQLALVCTREFIDVLMFIQGFSYHFQGASKRTQNEKRVDALEKLETKS